jgi:hypothetical protein
MSSDDLLSSLQQRMHRMELEAQLMRSNMQPADSQREAFSTNSLPAEETVFESALGE